VYDPRREAHEFVGDDRDEAVQKAAKFFGVEAEELSISDLPSGEIYGAAGRAVVVAVPRGVSPPSNGGGRRGGREERGGREDRAREPERDRDDEAPRRERGGRGRRGRGDRRDSRGPRAAEREPARSRDRDEPSEPTKGTAVGELGELGEFVLGVVERLDLGPFEVSESEEGDVLVIQVRGPGAQRLGRSESRAVDALQLIVNQASMRINEDRLRVVLEVEGDGDSREEVLESLAQRVARRARSGGRAVALDPMNPRDRRVIHVALRDEDGIATMSVGEGRYRQVVVVPEGAEEYEEALRQSRAAPSDG
jgi:spoIIIJ-associated protein